MPPMAIKIMRLPSDQFRARGYKTTPTPFFLLKTKKNSGKTARIATIIGKSAHKNAVKRNFWKRQVLTVVAAHATEGSDILIIASPKIDRLTKRQFKEELLKAMTRSQIK
jgi:ribonuclease P protein component